MKANPIDVENSINSGQVFLWKKEEVFWYGINGQDILKVGQSGRISSFQNSKVDFFREKDDLKEILDSISNDKIVKKSVKRYPGLRILRQDPFQCLISFIASSNSNIQKIKLGLERLSEELGKKVMFEGREFFLFPKPQDVAEASIDKIIQCGFGYRSKFIRDAARMVASKEIDFDRLEKSDYDDTKEVVCTIPGVGSKVADCVMLFSLNKLGAFPLDRWMLRVLEKYFSGKFHLTTRTMTEKQYQIMHEKTVDYFGPYSGYAQQFLFKMERENFQRKWL